jgi:hypothetical protein
MKIGALSAGMSVVPSARHADVANELMTAIPASVCIMESEAKKDVYHPTMSGGTNVGGSTARAP